MTREELMTELNSTIGALGFITKNNSDIWFSGDDIEDYASGYESVKVRVEPRRFMEKLLKRERFEDVVVLLDGYSGTKVGRKTLNTYVAEIVEKKIKSILLKFCKLEKAKLQIRPITNMGVPVFN